MGKGPYSIYNDCIASARSTDEWLANSQDTNDIQHKANLKLGCITMLERDVRLMFFKQNYSDKATERALKQWIDLSMAGRYRLDGYLLVYFSDYDTKIKAVA